jgi:hypothetical protein
VQRGARNTMARLARWREARDNGMTMALELGRLAMAMACSGDKGRWGKSALGSREGGEGSGSGGFAHGGC